MKYILTTLTVLLLSINLYSQDLKQKNKGMKLNSGIITSKLAETKAFYSDHLGFGVTFENDFYLLMHTPNKEFEIAFLQPNHPTQQPLFQKAYSGQGAYLTIEVKDVDSLYKKIKSKEVDIVIDIRNETWGDRHFAIVDPNGVGIDIVKYTSPTE